MTTAETKSYTISTEVFSGPLETLLEMIEKRSLSISDIALAEVADEYVAFVRGCEALPLEQATQFVFVASTLVLIKSRTLIPQFEISEEEEQDIHELELRMRLYAFIRARSRELHTRWNSAYLYGGVGEPVSVVFSPGQELTSVSITETAHALIDTFPAFTKRDEVMVDPVMSLDDMMVSIEERVRHAATLSFNALCAGGKEERIVGFLAVLELVKRGALTAEQTDTFNDIVITNTP